MKTVCTFFSSLKALNSVNVFLDGEYQYNQNHLR